MENRKEIGNEEINKKPECCKTNNKEGIGKGILYPFGFLLNPIIAGIAMAFSSVSVVGNTLLMQRRKF